MRKGLFDRHKRAGQKSVLVIGYMLSFVSSNAFATEAGDFDVALSYSANGQARTAAPSPATMAGVASFGVWVAPSFLIAGSTQIFTSAKEPNAGRTWSYGVTKFEFNRDFKLTDPFHFEADYTIVLPTSGPTTPGTKRYAHQFLAMFNCTRSRQNYFEVDVGDYMSGRAAAPVYKNTALVSVVAQHNLQNDGNSNSTYDLELDASPSVEGAPASAVFTAGAEHNFKSGLTVVALASAGLRANDPVIGVTLRLKFGGNLAGKAKGEMPALNYSRLQRLERPRFVRIGRF